MRLGDATLAYSEASPKVKKATAKSQGSRFLRDPNIAARVLELRERITERTEITVASLIEELEEDRKLARKAGQLAAAVKATETIAKLAGLWVDKSESMNIMHPDEARALIAQLGAKYLPAASK